MVWSHESFVGFRFRDLENKTFSYDHSHYNFRLIVDVEHFFKNLENGSIDVFETLTTHAW